MEERIKHLNLVLRAIRRVNQLIVKGRDRDRLLQGACDRLIETRGYYNTWIALLDESGGVVTIAEAGLGKDFTPMVKRLKRGKLAACGQEALLQSGVVVTEDPASACADCPLSPHYAGRGAMTVRLEHGGKVYGLLSASIPAHLTADEEEQVLFEEVSRDIAFALHNIELEEERVRAEEALRESEERYRLLIENSGSAVTMVNIDGFHLFLNEMAAENLGGKPGDFVGETFHDLFPKDDAEEYLRRIRDVVESGVGRIYEDLIELPSGNRWFSTNMQPMVDANAKIKSVQMISRDITERKRAEEGIKRRNQELAALNSIATVMMQSTLSLDKLLQQIADNIVEALNCTTVFILLLDEEERVFKGFALSTKEKIIERINAIIGFPLVQIELPARADFNEAVRNALDGRMTIKDDLYELASPLLSKRVCSALEKLAGSKTFLSVPLMTKGRILGGILASTREEIDEKDEETMMTFANQAAAVIEHARLDQAVHEELAERIRAEKEREQSLERLRRTLEEMIHALASAVEMRDPYTAGHQRRVTELACAIANEMDLPQEQIEGLRMAGLIHDIGKINVPAEILSKPGPLNTTEFALIKAHPQVGHDILKEIDFPWPVADIVLQHHERMDGSGYPKGIKGEEMLLEARILGVADVVEAMSSHRPYRPAHSVDEALEEISQNRDVLYDPEVVDACLKLFTEKGFTFK